MAAAIVWLQLKGLSDPEQVNYSSRWWITPSEPRFCLTPPVSAVCCAAHNSWRLFKLGHRELKPRRRGRQQERQKSNRFRLAKNNFARASRFFVDFFAVTVRVWRETSCPNFYVFWRTWTQDRLSSYFPELWFSPLELNSRNVCQHLTNWTRWNKCGKLWSSANSLSKWRFRSRRLCCCLSFLHCNFQGVIITPLVGLI